MWTAIIKEKGVAAQGTYVDVSFTDGTSTVVERCYPQDLAGFKYWVNGRLSAMNVSTDIDAKYAVGGQVVVNDPVVTPTAAEIAQAEWFNDFRRLQQVQKLVDLGIILNTNARLVALRDKLKTGLKVEYIDAL